MKLEIITKAPENAGIDPSTMRVSKWYQESTREDDDPHSPSLTRVWSRQGVIPGTRAHR